MRLWERLSGNIYRIAARPYLSTFENNAPEKVLKRSLALLDPDTIDDLKEYVRGRHAGGGFRDKAGYPDLYYTLFGFFLADVLHLSDLLPSIADYVSREIESNDPAGVHLNCAAILSSKLHSNKSSLEPLFCQVRNSLNINNERQAAYGVFLSLLTCYYIRDFKGLFLIKKELDALGSNGSLPSPVVAALLVIQGSFKKPVDTLQNRLISFRDGTGGFKALAGAPVPDLLSTSVALYALKFTGYDLSIIKPGCLEFVDSLYNDGGFGGNIIDNEPDLEYTFYGLLALGSLTN